MPTLRSKLAQFRWQNGTGFVLEGRRTRPTAKELIHALVRHEIDAHRSVGLPTRYFLGNFEERQKEFGSATATKALTDETRHSIFWTVLDEMEIGRSFNLIASTLAGNPNIDRKRLVAAVRKRLEAIGVEDWRNAILEDLTVLPLAKIYRHELDQGKALGDDLRVALREQGQNLLSAPSAVRERWFELVDFVTPSARATLLKNLRDRLYAGNPVENIEELIFIGGERLMTEGKFAEESDRTARHVLVPLLGSEDGRSIVVEQGEFFAKIASKSAKETKLDMQELLDAIGPDVGESDDIDVLRKTLRL